MRTPFAILTLALVIALVLGGLWIGQNVNLLPVDASANAPVYDELFRVLFSIGAILFLGIVGLVVFSLIKFRRRPGQLEDGLAIEDNLPLEIFWTAVPAVVVLFVGLYSFDIYDRMGGMVPLAHDAHDHQMMDMKEQIWGGIGSVADASSADNSLAALAVEVIAMQYAFIFHYPQGDIISGELHVPLGQPVTLRMESKDVIHAFWVPEFRIKQDIIPGQPTLLNFTATKPGRYPIICAELCGPYHGNMHTKVIVEAPGDYDTWFSNNAKTTVSEA